MPDQEVVIDGCRNIFGCEAVSFNDYTDFKSTRGRLKKWRQLSVGEVSSVAKNRSISGQGPSNSLCDTSKKLHSEVKYSN